MQTRIEADSNVEDAYAAATGSWVDADWTHVYIPPCSSPDHETHTPCPGCRPQYDDDGEPVYCTGSGDHADCQECADARDAARDAEHDGALALARYRAGDVWGAVEAAEGAESAEMRFGDAPTWRPLVSAIRAAADAD